METQTKILKELQGIRKDLGYIKQHIADADVILTDDDIESLREAERDWKEGKTKRLL